MTDDMMNLQALVEKSADADFLREMIGFAAQRLMELEVGGLTGAALWREERRAARPAQRLPRPRLGDARRHGRAAHPQAAQGQLLPRLPRAAAAGREGADRGHPGGLHPGHLDPLGRRSGQGDGHERHLQEPGEPAVRGDRRAGEGLPRPADRGRLALPLDRRDLREGAPGRPHRLGRGHHRRRRQQRRPARGARHGDRPVRGRDLLDRLPAQPRPARPARREAGHLRRPRGHQGRGRQVFSATWQRCRVHFTRNALAHAGKSGRRVVSAFIATAFAQETAEAAKAQWRKVADQLRPDRPQARHAHGQRRGGRAGLHELPAAASHQAALAPIRSSASTARSSGAPRSSASSPTRTPSPASSAPSCSNRTTNGPSSAPAT